MNRRRIMMSAVASIACGACGLVLGIDGDVIDPVAAVPEGGSGDEQARIDAGPPLLEFTAAGPLRQGGTITLQVKRAAGSVGTTANVTLGSLPPGVTALPFDQALQEGATKTITLVAVSNARLGEYSVTLTGLDFAEAQRTVKLAVIGNLDTTFGTQGVATVPFEGVGGFIESFGLGVDPASGQIYVTFTRSDADEVPTTSVARYLENGTLDKSFGQQGFVDVDGGTTLSEGQGRAVFVEPSGVIVFGDAVDELSFQEKPFSFAYPSNGLSMFVGVRGGGGANEATTVNVARHAGGGFVGLSTSDVAPRVLLFHATPAGLPDPSRPNIPIPVMREGEDVAAGSTGTVIFGSVGPSDARDAMIVRRLVDGGADPSFGDGGVARANGPRDNTAHAGAIEASGAVLFAGDMALPDAGVDSFNTAMRVGRLTGRGLPDPMFGDGGIVELIGPDIKLPSATAHAVLSLPDGKILVTGALEDPVNLVEPARVVVARFKNNGAIDTDFGWQGLSIVRLPFAIGGRRLAVQKGNVIVGALVEGLPGQTNVALMRYKPLAQ
jgi:uncharacterized delta-60 repeat protein